MSYNTLDKKKLDDLRSSIYLLLVEDKTIFNKGLLIIWIYELLANELARIGNLPKNTFRDVLQFAGILNSVFNMMKDMRDAFVHEGIYHENIVNNMTKGFTPEVLEELCDVCEIATARRYQLCSYLKSL